MRRSIFFVLTLGVFLAMSFPLCAQVGTQGAIVGTVTDSTGAVIPGAEITVVQAETGFTRKAATDASGDFSGYPLPVIDPATGAQFPGNIIPPSQFNPASKFFVPYLPVANGPKYFCGGLYEALANNSSNTYESTARIDHYITEKQRIYGRWVHDAFRTTGPGYLPTVTSNNDTDQDNIALNYMYTLKPDMLLTVTGGYLRSDNTFTSPQVGKVDYAQQAGIQGFSSPSLKPHWGIPTIAIGQGYPGTGLPFGVNGALWSRVENLTAELRIMKSKHSIGFGYELDNRAVFGQHGSSYAQDFFAFNGQYTGNGLADYLLDLTSSAVRNLPLNTFGIKDAPYQGLYAQDFWHVLPSLTVNLGLRYERWNSMSFVAGNTSTFDPKIGKVVVGEGSNGQVDLNQQPVAPFLAAATKDLWVPASAIGAPKSLYPPQNHLEPRVGFAWKPSSKTDLVVRGAYGIFENNFTGNRAASSIGTIPFFSIQTEIFSASQLQNWQTAFPSNPQNFAQSSVNNTTSLNIDATKSQEWNVSVQKALPLNSALTLSYVGSNVTGQPFTHSYNEVPPGHYTNLQAAKPYTEFGTVYLMENGIHTWYNGLQARWERRFDNGLYFMLAYCYAKSMSNYADATGELSLITPFAPPGYERGPSLINNTHNLKITSVYLLPVGRGRRFFSGMNRAEDAVLGGWQLGGYYAYISGFPLSFYTPGASLGNGWGTRADLIGNPRISNPAADGWFNTATFVAAPQYQFGNSGIGIVTGPGIHQMNLSLMKNFYVTEGKDFQIRAEAYNFLNNVNLGNPDTTVGDNTFGKILSAGGAREIQLGVKFIF